MAGRFGADFDPVQPADSDMVKLGASWIRDLKNRLKSTFSFLFNLESGDFKDNVIRPDSLIDNGVAPGTYTQVTVNSKGLVTEGDNPTTQSAAKVYQARFSREIGAIDSDTGVTFPAPGTGTYMGVGSPFRGAYATLSGSVYSTYTFQVPANVRRLKVIVVGGGGGGTATHGGGGAEHVEGVLPVTPLSNILIVVGAGGAPDQCGSPSLVDVGSHYVEAAGGEKAIVGAGGLALEGSRDSETGVVPSGGGNGTATDGGPSGSYLFYDAGRQYGEGGRNLAPNGVDGIVILEWIV